VQDIESVSHLNTFRLRSYFALASIFALCTKADGVGLQEAIVVKVKQVNNIGWNMFPECNEEACQRARKCNWEGLQWKAAFARDANARRTMNCDLFIRRSNFTVHINILVQFYCTRQYTVCRDSIFVPRGKKRFSTFGVALSVAAPAHVGRPGGVERVSAGRGSVAAVAAAVVPADSGRRVADRPHVVDASVRDEGGGAPKLRGVGRGRHDG